MALDCPRCGLPAQIVDRFTLGGSPGPVEHVKIQCIVGHWFTPLAKSLSPTQSDEVEAASDGAAEPVFSGQHRVPVAHIR